MGDQGPRPGWSRRTRTRSGPPARCRSRPRCSSRGATDITASVKAADWTWYATGPGVGIQLRSGRLAVPCDHYRVGSKAAGAHVISSEDHGTTGNRGGAVSGGVNECQAVELEEDMTILADGTIGCLYERGEKQPYERITFARFDISWLASHGGRPTP